MTDDILTDMTANSPVLQARRRADADEPSANVAGDVYRELPMLPSRACLPAAVVQALEALDVAEERHTQAMDGLAGSKGALRRARLADADALKAAALSDVDLSALGTVDEHEQAALGAYDRALAIAWATTAALRARGGAVKQAARQHADEIAATAAARLAEIGPLHEASVAQYLGTRSAYAAAVNDTSFAIRFAAGVEYSRSPGQHFEHERRAAERNTWAPSTASAVRVGSKEVDIGDMLAAVVEDARRHVQPPAKNDKELQRLRDSQTRGRVHIA